MRKLRAHHNLAAVQARFSSEDTLVMTTKATEDARTLGYSRPDVVMVVQQLRVSHFVKSETAHSPPNSRVWHDTYIIPQGARWLYLKFAGETLIDVKLTSFKETRHG